MFDSEITIDELYTKINYEDEISATIEREIYYNWINTIEQLLYSEIIKEEAVVALNLVESLASFPEQKTYANFRFEDISKVYGILNGKAHEHEKTTAGGALVHSGNMYFKSNDKIGIKSIEEYDEYKAVVYIRPRIKTTAKETIKLPWEFIDLVEAKIRGEKYKLVDNSEMCARWLNEYNARLEDFKAWIGVRNAQFKV